MNQIKFKRLHNGAILPTAANHGDALDIYAPEEYILEPNAPTLIKTGWNIELPAGFRAWVTPRSGLALKHGITVANAPGLIDPQYRGELGVLLVWSGHEPNLPVTSFEYKTVDTITLKGHGEIPITAEIPELRYRINPGDRIAQLTLQRIEPAEAIEVSELSESARGESGFGSTGK